MSKDLLLAQRPRRLEAVDLGPRGVHYVRSLYVPDAMAHYKAMEGIEDKQELAALQLAAFVCDAAGVPELTLEEARELVPRLEWQELNAILKTISGMNSLGNDALEDARKKA